MGAQTKLLVELGLNNTKNINDMYINNKIKEIRKKVCNINDKDKVMMLLKTITYIDLTSLNIDDSPETIESLCLKVYICLISYFLFSLVKFITDDNITGN